MYNTHTVIINYFTKRKKTCSQLVSKITFT